MDIEYLTDIVDGDVLRMKDSIADLFRLKTPCFVVAKDVGQKDGEDCVGASFFSLDGEPVENYVSKTKRWALRRAYLTKDVMLSAARKANGK